MPSPINLFFFQEDAPMSHSEVFVNQDNGSTPSQNAPKAAGLARQGLADKSLECFLATGLGSRGGPNKVTNKFKRTPRSYLVF
jgi:hypothetical protein